MRIKQLPTETTMKIALVTGGSRGLGKSMALHIACKGDDVVLTYNSRKADAEAVVKQIEQTGRKAAALALDLSDSRSFDGFVAKLKEVLQAKWNRDDFDFLVNNAGIGIYSLFAETSEKQFDELMSIHLKGPLFLTQKLLPLIKDGGRIVNISTGLARFTLPGYAAYAAMKGGIEVLTRYMAKELGARKITVNVVALGRLKQISPAALCVTTKKSTNSSLRRVLLDASGCPTISAEQSLFCWRRTITGSPVSESKPLAALSSETGDPQNNGRLQRICN
jgi:NAD(P)-dependent dehydrogenase (short-subunit alcohol dehydrogenase family)